MRSFASVFAILLSAASFAQAYQESHVDDWDVSRGTVVTSHSELDHDPPAGNPYDIRDLFGGSYGTYAPEPQRVVFYDGSGGTGYVDNVEWQSPSALGIRRFTMAWGDDHPSNDWRTLAHFTLFGKLTATDAWTALYDTATPQAVGEGRVDGTLTGNFYQYWRAEFTRGFSTNSTATADRVYEIDGWINPVPEPASLAPLALGALALVRRRRQ